MSAKKIEEKRGRGRPKKEGRFMIAKGGTVYHVVANGRIVDSSHFYGGELDPESCSGPGRCHSTLRWCDTCGDVSATCEWGADCDVHRIPRREVREYDP